MKKPKRRYTNGAYARLEADVIESEAFGALSSANSVRVLIRFWQKRRFKRRGKKGKGRCTDELANNGDIKFTYDEASEFGMSESTFLRVIKELVALGFIDIDEENQDGFIPGKGRMPIKYTISHRWRHYGTPIFTKIEKPRVHGKGIGFKPGNRQGKNSSLSVTDNR